MMRSNDIIVLENRLKSYIIRNPNMNLKAGEVCYFQGKANAVKLRNATIGSQRTSIYSGLKSYAGVYLGAGLSNTKNIRGTIADKYPGNFYITNQRMILSSIKYGFEIPLQQITTLNFMNDGFWLTSNGKTYVVETINVMDIKNLIQTNNEYMMLKKEVTEFKQYSESAISYTDHKESRYIEGDNSKNNSRNTIQHNDHDGVTVTDSIISKEIGRTKSQMGMFVLCLFFGLFGIHKFVEKKYKLGVAYFFTGGLFGIGWIYDLVQYYKKEENSRKRIIMGVTIIVFLSCLLMTMIFAEKGSKESTSNTEKTGINKNNMSQTEKLQSETTENDNIAKKSWKEFSKDKSRYKEVMLLLGNCFSDNEYTEKLDHELKNDTEKELVKNLFDYYRVNSALPEDFIESFTNFCLDEEYKDMFFEDNNEFYDTLSKSFKISWGSDGTYYIEKKIEELDSEKDNSDEVVSDADPLIFTIDENKYTVGDCFFSVKEIQIASFPFKAGSRSVCVRIYGEVQNNSDNNTFFGTTRYNSWVVGTYHGEDWDDTIGAVSEYEWKTDTEKKKFSRGCELKAGEKCEFSTQGVYQTTLSPTYEYSLKNIELYFYNNDELFTLTFD